MSNDRFVVRCMFDLTRGGFMKHDTLLTSSDNCNIKSIDARSIAMMHNEMECVIDNVSDILRLSNTMRSKWIYSALIYVLLLIPLNIFCMIYSVKHDDIISFILSIILLFIITLCTIYKMEYYLMQSVYLFLLWNSKAMSLLRDYSHNVFNKDNKYSEHHLIGGVSYDVQSGLYQLIAHIDDNDGDCDEKQNETNKDYKLYYKFNDDYIAPIMCEVFDVNDICNKGIAYYHEWSIFIDKFLIVFHTFVESDIVHHQRLKKIRQSALKQIRRMFILFGVSSVIAVPLIVNGSDADHNHNISTCVLIEGVLLLVFSLFTMRLCCAFYEHSCTLCKNKISLNKKDKQQSDALVVMMNEEIESNAELKQNISWSDHAVLRIDDLCNDLNSETQHMHKYTFSNEKGFFDTPNSGHYTGKISISYSDIVSHPASEF